MGEKERNRKGKHMKESFFGVIEMNSQTIYRIRCVALPCLSNERNGQLNENYIKKVYELCVAFCILIFKFLPAHFFVQRKLASLTNFQPQNILCRSQLLNIAQSHAKYLRQLAKLLLSY